MTRSRIVRVNRPELVPHNKPYINLIQFCSTLDGFALVYEQPESKIPGRWHPWREDGDQSQAASAGSRVTLWPRRSSWWTSRLACALADSRLSSQSPPSSA